MSKIELGRYSELLRRALGMKGVETIASELSPEISPTWSLEGDDPEWQFLKQVRLAGGAGQLSSAAGTFVRFQIVNPAASGMIATIEELEMTSLTDEVFDVRLHDVELGPLGGAVEIGPRDTRWAAPGTIASPLLVTAQAIAAIISGGFLLHHRAVLASTVARFNTPVVLAPGSSIQWGVETANTTVNTALAWKERAVTPLEL